jgi:hypothetical protein
VNTYIYLHCIRRRSRTGSGFASVCTSTLSAFTKRNREKLDDMRYGLYFSEQMWVYRNWCVVYILCVFCLSVTWCHSIEGLIIIFVLGNIRSYTAATVYEHENVNNTKNNRPFSHLCQATCIRTNSYKTDRASKGKSRISAASVSPMDKYLNQNLSWNNDRVIKTAVKLYRKSFTFFKRRF